MCGAARGFLCSKNKSPIRTHRSFPVFRCGPCRTFAEHGCKGNITLPQSIVEGGKKLAVFAAFFPPRLAHLFFVSFLFWQERKERKSLSGLRTDQIKTYSFLIGALIFIKLKHHIVSTFALEPGEGLFFWMPKRIQKPPKKELLLLWKLPL